MDDVPPMTFVDTSCAFEYSDCIAAHPLLLASVSIGCDFSASDRDVSTTELNMLLTDPQRSPDG